MGKMLSLLVVLVWVVIVIAGCGRQAAPNVGEDSAKQTPPAASEPDKQEKLPGQVLAVQGRHHRYLMSNPGYQLYFDTGTIKYDANEDGQINRDVIDVWMIGCFNSLGVERAVQSREKLGKDSNGWQDLDYELLHYLINRKGMYYRTLQFVWVDKSGRVLDNLNLEPYNLGWDWVSNGSISEQWVKELSAYAANNDLLLQLEASAQRN